MEKVEVSHALNIRLFGPMSVLVEGEPMPKIRTRRGLWLLALLVLRAGREVDRNWLAGTLWPECTDEQALGNLRRTLTDLRSALGSQGFRLRSPATRTILFDSEGAEIDVLNWEELIASTQLSELEKATLIAKAPLLEGCQEEWLYEERETRLQQNRAALERIVSAYESNNDPVGAIRTLKRLIALDPLNEAAVRRLMVLLGDSGQFAASVVEYRTLRERLRYELNIEPSAETNQVFREVRTKARSGVAALEQAINASPMTPSASRHELTRASTSLPSAISSFVGRQREIHQVIEALDRARLVTLVGMGGMGKTRLALEVGRQLSSTLGDTVHFVDLMPTTDVESIEAAVAASTGASLGAGSSALEGVLAELIDTKALLIFDNCEHVVGPVSSVIRKILTHCESLRVLATSRQALEISGERRVSVGALSLPIGPSRAEVEDSEAGALFLARLRSATDRDELTDLEYGAIDQICRRLDGSPLAIELAAARGGVLTLEQISRRLHDRFKLLISRDQSAAPRQQTLQALIDWSYDLLVEEEKAALRMLSVFSGPFDQESADTVLADPAFEAAGYDAIELISNLVAKSLVVIDDTHSGTRRYRLLESIAEYALGKLMQSGGADAVRSRHFEWYQAMAEQATEYLVGRRSQEWIQILNRDRDNIRTAIKFATFHGKAEQALRMIYAIWRFWDSGAEFVEGRRLAAEALEAGVDVSAEARAMGHYVVGTFAWRQVELDTAEDHLVKARTLAAESGNRLLLGQATTGVANTLHYQSRSLEALVEYRAAGEIYESIGYDVGAAAVHNNIGAILHTFGRFEESVIATERAIELRKRIGDPIHLSSSYQALAIVFASMERYDDADSAYVETAKILREIHDTEGRLRFFENIAQARLQRGFPRDTIWMFALTHKYREIVKSGIAPIARGGLEETFQQAREMLSDEEYKAAYEMGYSLNLEDAFEQVFEMYSSKEEDGPP